MDPRASSETDAAPDRPSYGSTARGKAFLSVNNENEETQSIASGRKDNSLHHKSKRKRKTADDGHAHYYAGIIHSDLDIQTGRRPLMFHMNFVEWLWFQSGVRQRILVMLVAFLCCLALMQFVFSIILFLRGDFYENPYLCQTERCLYLSKRLRQTLNKSVDPCKDFYSFVCGSNKVIKDMTPEEDVGWNYGFDAGRVVYDFRYSKTLGRMLHKIREYPTSLVLDMYQACLERRKTFHCFNTKRTL